MYKFPLYIAALIFILSALADLKFALVSIMIEFNFFDNN